MKRKCVLIAVLAVLAISALGCLGIGETFNVSVCEADEVLVRDTYKGIRFEGRTNSPEEAPYTSYGRSAGVGQFRVCAYLPDELISGPQTCDYQGSLVVGCKGGGVHPDILCSVENELTIGTAKGYLDVRVISQTPLVLCVSKEFE